MSDHLTRRTFVRSTAAVSVTGLLAGCGGSGGGDGGSGGDGGDGDGDGGDGGDGGSGEVPSEVSDYLSDVENFDGSVADETGNSAVEVEVGAEGNGGNFAFAPPAVRVDAGTEVDWIWTGEGGSHNVVSEEDAFESELVSEEGHTFQHTFEETGVYLYFCEPHKGVGMKGAVVVV